MQSEAYDDLNSKLETREGENDIFKVATIREEKPVLRSC